MMALLKNQRNKQPTIWYKANDTKLWVGVRSQPHEWDQSCRTSEPYNARRYHINANLKSYTVQVTLNKIWQIYIIERDSAYLVYLQKSVSKPFRSAITVPFRTGKNNQTIQVYMSRCQEDLKPFKWNLKPIQRILKRFETKPTTSTRFLQRLIWCPN